MGYWVIATVMAVIACEVVLAALWCGERPASQVADEPGLVEPRTLGDGSFATVCRGYDRAEVDRTYRRLADAYEALYESADATTRDRARHRLSGDAPV